MGIRVVTISTDSQSDILKSKELSVCESCEHTINPSAIEVFDTDDMVIVWAKDNRNKAVEVARTFCQGGVLTVGVLQEYIEECGCFDAQTIGDERGINNIVRALVDPVVYPGPISFDFNDIHTTLKEAGKFFAGFVDGSDVDNLISKTADEFSRYDLGRVGSACINLYCDANSDVKTCGINKVKTLLDMMPAECSTRFGIHYLPKGIEMPFAISYILAGKNLV